MTHTTHSLRYAGTAIAAALAIASTPGFSQDSAAPFPTPPPVAPAPEIVVPDIPVPAAPEPTLVLPTEPLEPATADDAAVESPTTEAPPVPARTRLTPSTERAAPARAPEPVVGESDTVPSDETAELPPPASVAADPAPPLAIEPAAEDNAELDTGLLAVVLGGLAFLALAIWGFIAIGRRKPVRRYVAVAPQPVTQKPTVAAPAVVSTAEPAGVEPRPVQAVAEPLVTPAPSSIGLLPHAGASVALPRRLPESFEEREALFRRMVDARPDRANPFTDRKARMKRARLIMQSIGRDFGDTQPWIDLSQYPQNWPELSQRRSAAA